MKRIASASENERKAIFLETSKIKNIPAAMVEKDFWVCFVLDKIFSDDFLKNILCFKGGTSLSKVFHVIERFSEDIDLILDWTEITTDKVEKDSISQQTKFNKILEKEAQKYISTLLKDKIEKILAPYCSVESDVDDGHNLNISYPKAISDPYLRSSIKLEVGPLAAWEPNDIFPVESYVGEANTQLNIAKINVPAIKGERTFWEKVTILHCEHFRSRDEKMPSRYSRHYYDLFKMGHSDIKKRAFADLELLAKVAAFKDRFYRCPGARYDLAKSGTIRLLPAEIGMKILEDDYKSMKNMIFGDYPKWADVVAYLTKLENEINKLK